MKDFEFELPLYAIKMKLTFHPEDEMKNKIESLFNQFICPAPQAKTTPTKVNISGHPLLTNCFALGS